MHVQTFRMLIHAPNMQELLFRTILTLMPGGTPETSSSTEMSGTVILAIASSMAPVPLSVLPLSVS